MQERGDTREEEEEEDEERGSERKRSWGGNELTLVNLAVVEQEVVNERSLQPTRWPQSCGETAIQTPTQKKHAHRPHLGLFMYTSIQSTSTGYDRISVKESAVSVPESNTFLNMIVADPPLPAAWIDMPSIHE